MGVSVSGMVIYLGQSGGECTSYDTFLEILHSQMNECLPWKMEFFLGENLQKRMDHKRHINIL